MFQKIFSRKKKYFSLKRSDSVENVSLNGKIIINHCTGHNTIILIILVDRFKEKTLKLFKKMEVKSLENICLDLILSKNRLKSKFYYIFYWMNF